ncbi:hypothetical protein M407DRAFT_29210 [Tulasnella calospora MUT 4182]|uniref:Uncharacterized protein n=1 Tax=Tulasnella calospora MUT 4182 TaxID=1051891 RepID=A0A0C3LI90_9AGAM|nr:hypothetical protein M407DRAFT_29210 [Tulasnella calospora MUT 4182]
MIKDEEAAMTGLMVHMGATGVDRKRAIPSVASLQFRDLSTRSGLSPTRDPELAHIEPQSRSSQTVLLVSLLYRP